ncbi:MAG: glycosyltransferase family 39 protein [Candidatus Aureabacteria bacterium]|nr:glycosyltransferase family 39 protein [Candidatus Auribacterota bacterium]
MDKATRDALLLSLLAGCVLVIAAAARSLGGIEFRTALFVREIIQNGPSLIPRLDGAPYYDYPPLYFLAAAATGAIAGSTRPIALALPSIIAAMGTVYMVARLAARGGRVLGCLAGAALLATPMFLDLSSQATVDALLVFFITLTLTSYYRYLSAGAAGALLVSLAGIAGGVLTKGPVGGTIPLAVLAVFLVLRHSFRRLAGMLLILGAFIIILGAVRPVVRLRLSHIGNADRKR